MQNTEKLQSQKLHRAEYVKRYYAENKERLLALSKKRYQEKRVEILAASKIWREKNAEKIRQKNIAWYKKSPARWRRKLYGLTEKDEIALNELHKAGCVYCGSMGALELDHIFPRAKGGTNALSNLQWLCRMCNRMKFDVTEPEFFEHIKKLVEIRRQFEDNAYLGSARWAK